MIKICGLIFKSKFVVKHNFFVKKFFSFNNENLEIPTYVYNIKDKENIEVRKNRLIYQSRRRGMLENDLLLSTFVDEYLSHMSLEMIDQYDRLINTTSNDWDIYYWATGSKPVPSCFNNDLMKLLQYHTCNSEKKSRLRQPDLKTK